MSIRTILAGRSASSVVATLLLIHGCILAWGAWRNSPTLNEPAHLAAGLAHWQLGRFDLYQVNPPLVHMVAALPVLAVGYQSDWNNLRRGLGARPEFDVGRDFIKANGPRLFWLVTLARWACIPFSLLGGYVVYCWAQELYGTLAGLLAIALWCFCPNILAHGQLITSDLPATALGVTCMYFFWQWLKCPTMRWVFMSGVATGLAELSKSTWIILFPLFPLLWVSWLTSQPALRQSLRLWSKQAVQLVMLLAIALGVLNLGYGFGGSFRPLGSFCFASRMFTEPEGEGAQSSRGRSYNRFANSWVASVPMPVPEDYLLGIDLQERDVEQYGRPFYLHGELRDHGWWYYYLYGLAIKTPLGTWILLVMLIIYRLSRRRPLPIAHRDEFILLVPPIVVLIVVSSQTGLNEHFRYVLPIFPFLYIILGQVVWLGKKCSDMTAVLAGSALLWTISSSFWYCPHYLSYFNELVGGPQGGHAHLINSNIDWGQDLLYLRRWLERHPEVHNLKLAYYGEVDPRMAEINFSLPIEWSMPSNASHVNPIPSGWYAISVNFLHGYPAVAPDGEGGWRHLLRGACTRFLTRRPIASAGYSIYIYFIESDEGSGGNATDLSKNRSRGKLSSRLPAIGGQM